MTLLAHCPRVTTKASIVRKLIDRPRAVSNISAVSISADEQRLGQIASRYQLRLIEPCEAGREDAQAFIHTAYRLAFNANLKTYYPSIVTLHNEAGVTHPAILGAVGARSGLNQNLFLEQYLDASVQQMLTSMTGFAVQRERVVELGNLAVLRPALTYPFMSMLGSWLLEYQVEWLVFALTTKLRQLFLRAGLTLHELGQARESSLTNRDNDWGDYYQHDPRIVAVELAPAVARFGKFHIVQHRRPARHARPLLQVSACT